MKVFFHLKMPYNCEIEKRLHFFENNILSFITHLLTNNLNSIKILNFVTLHKNIKF